MTAEINNENKIDAINSIKTTPFGWEKKRELSKRDNIIQKITLGIFAVLAALIIAACPVLPFFGVIPILVLAGAILVTSAVFFTYLSMHKKENYTKLLFFQLPYHHPVVACEIAIKLPKKSLKELAKESHLYDHFERFEKYGYLSSQQVSDIKTILKKYNDLRKKGDETTLIVRKEKQAQIKQEFNEWNADIEKTLWKLQQFIRQNYKKQLQNIKFSEDPIYLNRPFFVRQPFLQFPRLGDICGK